MKFGKRLAKESGRRPAWAHGFLDYRALKRAIKVDVAAQDPRGVRFEQALRLELQKVSAFYVEKEEEVAAAMGCLSLNSSPQEVAALRAELLDLRKLAALNTVAVVKAAKKRNRHLKAACGEPSVAPLRAAGILQQQSWFTSAKVATLSTQAEVLAQELAPTRAPASVVLAEYQCPICLDILRSPVVLTCAHRFCWGCLLAHCTAVQSRGSSSDGPGSKEGKQQEQLQLAEVSSSNGSAGGGQATTAEQQEKQQQGEQEAAEQRQQAVWGADHSSSDEEAHAVCCTFDCAVCRKGHQINLDQLHVDPHLDAFLQKLEHQRKHTSSNSSSGPAAAMTSSQPIPIGGTASAAAAIVAVDDGQGTVVEPRHRSGASTASLAEASKLEEAEAAAQQQREDDDKDEDIEEAAAAHRQQQALQAEAATGAVAAAAAPQQISQVEVIVEEAAQAADGEPSLLPPQRLEHRGRLVVCLDLDGTLVTTFTPKRAPLLPPTAVSYIVGKGGKLNPGGVFVVERPGLGDFLRRVSRFCEVVLFTAGLEDYAAPICDAIEARYGPFHYRLYRPATVASDVYPCIKDMARLGRDLRRCVLVDDTPLAFFRQPDHGIPVLQFRGDVDDRMLTEAVLPLLESLHASTDVAVPLARRFNMQKWFQAQGLTPPPRAATMHRNASLPQLSLHMPAAQLRSPVAPSAGNKLQPDASAAEMLQHSSCAGTLLCMDFDHTLTSWDAGERLCDELAPELTSLLSSLQMPANFVPVTNTVLAEMSRRGVTRDRLVQCLREMGREVPLASVRLLQWAASRGLHTVILSDCNSTFINHILTGARANTYVRQIITNQATFHRVSTAESATAAAPANKPATSNGFSGGWGFFRPSSSSNAACSKPPLACMHRLVIDPRHDHKACGEHGCPLCPANLCKGRELAALRAVTPHQKVVYCGDGANDLCPALTLGPQDVVLARAGHALERLISERAVAPASSGVKRVAAAVYVWHDHAELARLVQLYAS